MRNSGEEEGTDDVLNEAVDEVVDSLDPVADLRHSFPRVLTLLFVDLDEQSGLDESTF